jgi:hypothetical protein
VDLGQQSIGPIRENAPKIQEMMSQQDARDELDFELEQIIICALSAQDALKAGNFLTDHEASEWANLIYGFNCGLIHLQMNMRTPHRAKELQ